MADQIPLQEVFLYKSNWTAEKDSFVLSIIAKSKTKGEWDGSVIPFDLLEHAVGVLTAEMGLPFTSRDVYERFRFLEHRYRAFKLVLDTEGVFWNVNTNVVFTSESIWKAIFKKNNLCSAYYYYGDPEYRRLTQLFGPLTVKKERHTEVVIISDGTAPLGEQTMPSHRGRPPASPTLVVSESVYSPITTNATKLRRRLFDEDGLNVDGGPTIEAPGIFYVPIQDGELIPKCAKTNTRNPSKKTIKPSASPHASSCGSTSSIAWWRNAFK
ncbi:hypothetical protein AAHA92_32288 [Salvia divinorum]|uniref:Myb/SANT-like domain-containing protein n=1 Tax=Salvia divinorum TaxID=28513 RepID=A0ABD1FKB5_SALDI